VLAELDNHFSKNDYLLGHRPCAGDFGLMGPLYAHLYRDPAPGALIQQKAPNVVKWVERMNSCPENVTDWHDEGVIPDSLYPLLARIFGEFWPVLLNTVAKTQEWIASNPQQDAIPTTIGTHEFKMGEAIETRAILTFHQWKFQRVSDLYESFSAQEKANINRVFKQKLGLTIDTVNIHQRLTRKNNKLVVDS
ncbi:glutathione binding-like protein, partial [Aliiglaciecola sp.]|nr:glutathione binding-like protein [Aliiglaciecola sp.]